MDAPAGQRLCRLIAQFVSGICVRRGVRDLSILVEAMEARLAEAMERAEGFAMPRRCCASTIGTRSSVVLAAASQSYAGAGQIGFFLGEAEAQEIFSAVLSLSVLPEEGGAGYGGDACFL